MSSLHKVEEFTLHFSLNAMEVLPQKDSGGKKIPILFFRVAPLACVLFIN